MEEGASTPATYPVIGIDLEQRDGENLLLAKIRDDGIYQATLNGKSCLVRRNLLGSAPAISVLITVGEDGDPERGHWTVWNIIREDQRKEALPEREKFTRALTEVIKVLEPMRGRRTRSKELEEGIAKQLCKCLLENLGEENIKTRQITPNTFAISVTGKVQFTYALKLFFNEVHRLLSEIAKGHVYKRVEKSDQFEAVYNSVPYSEMGYLLYLLGEQKATHTNAVTSTVDFKGDYDAQRRAFNIFELRITLAKG